MKIGYDYGIKNVGHLAIRILRIEKMIPFWGAELTSEINPLEVNRHHRIPFEEKNNFIGKEALLNRKKVGIGRRLVQIQLQNFDMENDSWPWGGEAIYRNGDSNLIMYSLL